MTNVRSPISYSELSLPFPEARPLWFADSASEWKRIYLDIIPDAITRPPSLLDCLSDLETLQCLPNQYDAKLAQLITLHSVSLMVGEYRQYHTAFTLYRRNDMKENPLAEDGDQKRLQHVIQDMRISCESDDSSYFQSMFELLSMHLFAPFEQIEILTGKEGKGEALAMYPLLEYWFRSQQARQAAWHAGQVIKFLRDVPPAKFADLHAMMLYQSSLYLWAYGALSNANKNRTSLRDITKAFLGSTEISLDGEDSLEIQRWVSQNRGIPTISTASVSASQESSPMVDYGIQGPISVHQIDVIMSDASRIMHSKMISKRFSSSLMCDIYALLQIFQKLGRSDLIAIYSTSKSVQ